MTKLNHAGDSEYSADQIHRKLVNLRHKPTFDRIISRFTSKQQATIEKYLPLQRSGVCVVFWRLAIDCPKAAMRYLNIEMNHKPIEPEAQARKDNQRRNRRSKLLC